MDSYFERMCAAAGVEPLNGEALNEGDQHEMLDCLKQFTTLAARHAETRRPGHYIEIGFFDYPEVNAFATTWQGQDAIALGWGIVHQLRAVFKSVLDLPGRFAWLPEEKRPAAATWLYECAKHFIFLHELGHIWNGHTSLIDARGVSAFIYEIRAFGEGALGNLDRQTMEMDADGFAAANIFSLGVTHNPFPAVNVDLDETYGDGATHLAMVILSVYFVFRLFDAAVDFDDEGLRAHPAPPLRQRMIAGSLAAHAEKTGMMEEAKAWPIIAVGISTAEDLYATYKGQERNDKAIQAAFSEDGDRYSRKLLRHWHVLRPQLDELKRGGILPATQEVQDDD